VEDGAGVHRQRVYLRRVSLMRRPVVRNGGAVRRPVAEPRRILFLAAEWIVARASPSPMRDAFATGDSKPSRKRGCDEARLASSSSAMIGGAFYTAMSRVIRPLPGSRNNSGKLFPLSLVPHFSCAIMTLSTNRQYRRSFARWESRPCGPRLDVLAERSGGALGW
jgi:hypothetical protein